MHDAMSIPQLLLRPEVLPARKRPRGTVTPGPPRIFPVLVTYTRDARCPACGYRIAKHVPDCTHNGAG